MMNITTNLVIARETLNSSLGKDKVDELINIAKAKVDEATKLVPEANEIDVVKLNIKLSKSATAKAIWALTLAE